jgi:long-subunit fatty acid transport protein
MPRRFHVLPAAVVGAALCLHGTAHAINGAQLGGNGIKNAAMGGASIALPLDAAAAANNPAGMAFVPSSAVLDLQVFSGHSTAGYVLPRAGLSRNTGQIDSTRTVQNLLVPAIHERAYTAGLSWQLDDHSELSFGYELNPRTTLVGTGASTGTTLTSKVQLFMFGYQYRY